MLARLHDTSKKRLTMMKQSTVLKHRTTVHTMTDDKSNTGKMTITQDLDTIGRGTVDASNAVMNSEINLKRQVKDHIENLIEKNPIVPKDLPEFKTEIVVNEPLQALYDDYSAQARYGGMIILYDQQGAGKTSAIRSILQAKTKYQPTRFLYLKPGDASTGEDLYNNLARRLGITQMQKQVLYNCNDDSGGGSSVC